MDGVLGVCHSSKGSRANGNGVARPVKQFAIYESDPRTSVPIEAERNAGDGQEKNPDVYFH